MTRVIPDARALHAQRCGTRRRSHVVRRRSFRGVDAWRPVVSWRARTARRRAPDAHDRDQREAEEQRSSESDDLSLQVSLVAGGSQTQKWPHFAQQSRQRHSGDGRRNPVSGHRQESKEYKWQGAPARCI